MGFMEECGLLSRVDLCSQENEQLGTGGSLQEVAERERPLVTNPQTNRAAPNIIIPAPIICQTRVLKVWGSRARATIRMTPDNIQTIPFRVLWMPIAFI